MDYQEIISAYTNNDLEVSDFSRKLDISKSILGRPKYRAVQMAFEYFDIQNGLINLCSERESVDNQERFYSECDKALRSEFQSMLYYVRESKAWRIMGLDQKQYSLELFDSSSRDEKIEKIKVLGNKYVEYLDYQGIADLTGCFKDKDNLTDEQIKKLVFIDKMFYSLKNQDMQREFFCLDPDFIEALIKFSKSNTNKFEAFISRRKKSVRESYDLYKDIFSFDDFMDIAENVSLVADTLKMSARNVIGIYSEISETEEEKKYVLDTLKLHEDVKNKVDSFNKIVGLETRVKEQEKNLTQMQESIQRRQEEEKQEKMRKIQKEQERLKVIGKQEGYTGKLDESIKQIQKTPSVKEEVIPVIITWFSRDKKSLVRTLGSVMANELANRIKKVEMKYGTRTSVFLITNADKKTTLDRMKELQKLLASKGLTRAVEGAFGGYSSFKIQADGEIKDVSRMSEDNREKIIRLIDSSKYVKLDKEMVDLNNEDYIRYIFTDKKDKSITKEYLNYMVTRLLKDEDVSRQPLKFLTFQEDSVSGIDVILKSQSKGLEKLSEYYRSKYDIKNQVNINIDDFGKQSSIEK